MAGCILALAGCSAAPSSTSAPPEGFDGALSQEEGQRVVVTRIPVAMAYSVGNQKLTDETNGQTQATVNAQGSKDGGPTQVDENATGILVEASWTCGNGECRFLFELENGQDEDVLRLITAADVRLEVPSESVRPGKWDAVLRPDSANSDVVGEIVVSVFYGGPVPADYSAL